MTAYAAKNCFAKVGFKCNAKYDDSDVSTCFVDWKEKLLHVKGIELLKNV